MFGIVDGSYRAFIRPLIFALTNPMTAHKAVLDLMRWAGGCQQLCSIVEGIRGPHHEELSQIVDGVSYRSPVVLASGFLKNVDLRVMLIMSLLGFGGLELGSFTLDPWPGNPGQTLWRLPGDGALVNWQGLPGDGAAEAVKILREVGTFSCPIGISTAAMPKVPEGENDIEVFAQTLEAFVGLPGVSYLVLNAGCPNHKHGKTYAQDIGLLSALLERCSEVLAGKPFYIKVPGDVTDRQLESIIETAIGHKVAGLIIANTSTNREGLGPKSQGLLDRYDIRNKGGLSGRPLFGRMLNAVRRAYQTSEGKLTIIASGGIFTADQAFRAIECGASLVQIFTGMIYQGPWLAEEINREISEYLCEENHTNIGGVIGTRA